MNILRTRKTVFCRILTRYVAVVAIVTSQIIFFWTTYPVESEPVVEFNPLELHPDSVTTKQKPTIPVDCQGGQETL